MMNTLIKTILSIVTATLLSPCAISQTMPPDLSGFWTIRYGQATTAQEQALFDKLPKESVFVDDAGGGELGKGEYSGVTLSSQALKEVNDYDFKSELNRETSCIPPSVAFYMQAPFPIMIHQGRDIIVFQIEYFDLTRVIFLDGREHPPEDAPRSKSGHSIGHWEGDELVVDTTHIASASFMNNGFNHSDNIHMVERFKISEDGKTLWSTEVFDDAEVFTGLAARFVSWSQLEGEYLYPYECNPGFWEDE